MVPPFNLSPISNFHKCFQSVREKNGIHLKKTTITVHIHHPPNPHPPSTSYTFLVTRFEGPKPPPPKKKTTYIHQFTDLYVFLGGHFRNLPLLPPNRLSQEHDSSTTGTTPRLLWLIRTQAGRSADNWSLAVFQRTPGVSLFQDAPGS